MNLYYDVHHQNWYKRPDWFGVVGVPRLYDQQDLRLSYVIWQERVSPSVVVELLGASHFGASNSFTTSISPSFPLPQRVYFPKWDAPELLSPSTEKEDLGETEPQPNHPPTKWEVYEQILLVPYYRLLAKVLNPSIQNL